MVADGDRVVLHRFVKFQIGQPVILIEVKRTLENIASVQQQHIEISAGALALAFDQGVTAGNAAMQRLGRRGTIENRLNARMVVIGVKNAHFEDRWPSIGKGEMKAAIGEERYGNAGSGHLFEKGTT
jgi:hypothetical protein